MRRKQLIRFLCFVLLFLSWGCTKDQLKDPVSPEPDPVDPETESAVVITPSVTMPVGTKYYFYTSQDGEPVILNAREDGTLNSKLKFGTYRLLAVNADAQGVEFRNMHNVDDAGVYLKSGEQPGDVYLLSIDEVVVEEGKTATYTATPRLLTHTLTLNLDLSTVSETVTTVLGTLAGFYPGVSLGNGEPVIADAATTTIAFIGDLLATRANSDIYPVTIRSFGLLNPLTEGNTYNSALELEITTDLGIYSESIDLTSTITGGLDEFGNLPSGAQFPVIVEVTTNPEPEPEPEDPTKSTPNAGAEDWEMGGNHEGILE